MTDLNPGAGQGLDPLSRLCRTFDPLFDPRPAALTRQAAAELAGLARIYDLDADRPPTAVWRDLRRMLVGQAEVEAGAPAPDPLTILVAEDDADTAADLVEALTDAGHRVVGPFQDAESAILAAGLHALDLALLDINLAGAQTGVDLARRLQQSWGVPSVFLSGDVATAARHAGESAAVLLKPYSTRQVLNAVAVASRSRTQPSIAPAI